MYCCHRLYTVYVRSPIHLYKTACASYDLVPCSRTQGHEISYSLVGHGRLSSALLDRPATSELPDPLAVPVHRDTEQTESSGQPTVGPECTLVTVSGDELCHAKGGTERNEATERANDDQDRCLACRVGVQQVCDCCNVGAHEAEVLWNVSTNLSSRAVWVLLT